RDLLTSKLATLDLNIYTTNLFALPGGPVGLALGSFFSRETYEINPDDQANINQPEQLGEGGVTPVNAGRKEVAFYGEIRVPIFSPEIGIAGLRSLELDAGARFEEFRNNNTNVLVPKVALRWQPFDEQLTIRSTWGEGFLEPSMTELYGPPVFGIGPSDFMGQINPETTVTGLPNKNLTPEDDRTWTGGFVYTPKWIPPQWGSLTFTADFWDIERTGLVGGIAPQVIIDEFLAQGGIGSGVGQDNNRYATAQAWTERGLIRPGRQFHRSRESAPKRRETRRARG
ncbi:MAG TPA: TonB-dependent receptor, partial [Chthoniobacterales bacterium]|nr:TonB-dependent receptor [Chthoniobacterales bacterium]